MKSINVVVIAGNLTRDPELRYLPNGTAVCDLNIALNESWTDKESGQKKESVCFIQAVVWKKTAEIAAEYLRKGAPVCVEGKLSQDTWENSEGKKQTKTKVTASKVHFLPNGKKEEVPTVVPDTDQDGGL